MPAVGEARLLALRAVLAGSVLVASLAGCSTRAPATTSRDGPAAFVSTIHAEDVRLRVRSLGPAAGRVAILVHGGPGLSLQTLLALDPLAGPARRLVYYDQRGAGESSKPASGDYLLDAQVRDLEAVRMWSGAAIVDLIGQSWGGLLVAAYAALHPERVHSLVLIGAAPLDWPVLLAGEQRFRVREAELQGQGLVPSPEPADIGDSCVPSLTALLPVYLGQPREPRPPFQTSCTASTEHATFAAIETPEGQSRLAVLEGRLSAYRGRALVIMGSRDPFGLPWLEREVEQLSGAGAQKLVVEGAGHLPWIEQPAVVLPALRTWLAG